MKAASPSPTDGTMQAPTHASAPAITHPAGRHVDVGTTRLWIDEEGEGEPLLLLAGGPGHSHLTFHPYFSALADAYRVIYVDYRGRGRSAPGAAPREGTLAG